MDKNIGVSLIFSCRIFDADGGTCTRTGHRVKVAAHRIDSPARLLVSPHPRVRGYREKIPVALGFSAWTAGGGRARLNDEPKVRPFIGRSSMIRTPNRSGS